MSQNLKQLMKAAGPAVQGLVAAAMSANEVADRQASKNFLEVLAAAVQAKIDGTPIEEFIKLMNAVRQNRGVVTSFEIEIAGAIASQADSAEGDEFAVSFTAGGSVAGFDLGASANYGTSSRKARSEKSNENFRITTRGSSFPENSDADFITQVAAFAFRLPPGVEVPKLPEDSGTGELIEALLPLVSQLIVPEAPTTGG